MIASVTTRTRKRFAPVIAEQEYTPDQAREILRTVMTEKFRRWLMTKALEWTDHDWHRSQELVQDTFLSLLKCRSYDPMKSSPTYYAVWRMRGLFAARNHQAAKLPRIQPLKHEPMSRPLTTSLETHEIVQGVQAAIAMLPEKEAHTIQERMKGRTKTEIANQSHVSRYIVTLWERNGMQRMAGLPLPEAS